MAKTAVITGGGNGIGQETALLFLENGFNVVIAGRHDEKLRDTLRLAGDKANQALAVVADVTDEAAVKKLFAAAVERFGRVDFLFNNAGTTSVGATGTGLLDVPADVWREVLDANLTSVFLCAKEAIRIMINQNPQGGRIVNNGSVSTQVPRPNSAPYVASKTGITGLTRSISLDFRRYNICCGQIDIGNAATEQVMRHAKGSIQADGEIRKEALMSVKDVARALLFMATLPEEANVFDMTILANQMPFVGRG